MIRTIIFVVLLGMTAFPQDSTLTDVQLAYQNAIKGVNWALNNIPEKKEHLSNDLIDNNTLLCSISLSKEVNGYKIESKGYYLNSEIAVKMYRSNDWLLKNNYLKPSKNEEPVKDKQTTQQGRKTKKKK